MLLETKVYSRVCRSSLEATVWCAVVLNIHVAVMSLEAQHHCLNVTLGYATI